MIMMAYSGGNDHFYLPRVCLRTIIVRVENSTKDVVCKLIRISIVLKNKFYKYTPHFEIAFMIICDVGN